MMPECAKLLLVGDIARVQDGHICLVLLSHLPMSCLHPGPSFIMSHTIQTWCGTEISFATELNNYKFGVLHVPLLTLWKDGSLWPPSNTL